MSSVPIRLFGDPVLRARTDDVANIDGRLAKQCESMFDTMYEAEGLGLAAPQVGVRRRYFVYDYGDGPKVVINPEIVEAGGEWFFEEGCLSVPGLSWMIARPKIIHLVGYDIDGEEISIEADEVEARLFQHEIDHLDGILLVDHLDQQERGEAMGLIREMGIGQPESKSVGGLSLP